jgi:hypothetical protein
MKELPQAIPDVNALLALEPEELGQSSYFWYVDVTSTCSIALALRSPRPTKRMATFPDVLFVTPKPLA